MNIKLIIILLISHLVNAADQSLQCGDWDPFKDEKCFKVFDNKVVQYYDDAKNTCHQNEASSLVTITSREEQDFLFNLLANVHKITNGVWIGAQYKEKVFKWTDSSVAVNFTNWADNYPRNISDYECVQMSLVDPYYGKWLNEPCNQNYLVVCQKPQNWLFSYLQQTVMELRQSMNETKNKLTNIEIKHEAELNEIKIEIAINATPPGTIAYFVNTTAPIGWLKANGQSLSRTAYSKLFAAIGTTFGSGDDSASFSVPDLRGEFIRGWSDGKDTDKIRIFGSSQVASIIPLAGYINGIFAAGSFAHQDRYGFMAANTFDDGFDDNVRSGETRNGITYPNDTSGGPNEMFYIETPKKGVITHWNAFKGTRPRNIALLACIKY